MLKVLILRRQNNRTARVAWYPYRRLGKTQKTVCSLSKIKVGTSFLRILVMHCPMVTQMTKNALLEIAYTAAATWSFAHFGRFLVQQGYLLVLIGRLIYAG